jgi:hypothetical protein
MPGQDDSVGPEGSCSRRGLLRAGAGLTGLAAVGTLAGCQDAPIIGDGDAGGVIDDVPAASQFVLQAEVGAILEDQQLRDAVNALLSDADIAPETTAVSEILDEAEGEFGLDPRQAETMTVFGATEEAAGYLYTGAILSTSWSDEQIESLIGDRTGITEPDTYGETPVYKLPQDPPLWFALPGDGEVIVGSEDATSDVLDLRGGDGTAVSGDLREDFTGTADGYVRFAATVPADQLPQDEFGPEMAGVFRKLQSIHGSVARGESRELSVTMELADTDAATTLEEQLNQGLTMIRQQAADAETAFPRDLEERTRDTLENTTISRSGTAITLTMPNGLQVTGVGILAIVATFFLGLGGQPDPTPAVAFDFQYDSTAQELRVTHTGGDTVQAAALSIRGPGIGEASWLDAGGSTSSDMDGEPAVSAGDAVTLEEVPAGYEAHVIWEPPAGDTSAVLAEHEGPDA